MSTDIDAIMKRSSHFTYDLVAGVLPGFTAICTGYFSWHYVNVNDMGVNEVLKDLRPANNASGLVLLFALLLACHLIGSICTSMARLTKRLAILQPNNNKIQKRVDAVFYLSKQWHYEKWLKVEDSTGHGHAVKWVARKCAVSNDDGSIVTTYHYKYHLYRAVTMVWLLHLLAVFLFLAVGGPSCRIFSYFGVVVVMGLVTWHTWTYYYERYWLAIALEFCSRDKTDVTNHFDLTRGPPNEHDAS